MSNLTLAENIMDEKIDVSNFLSKPWQKFFAKFEEINTLKVSQWKEVHILAYICKRYKETYNQDWVHTIKGAPSKCNDIQMIKKIFVMFNTSNQKIVKDYIDWVFDEKLLKNKRKIPFKKISFFLTPGFGNEFVIVKKQKPEYRRSTELPDNYKWLANELGVYANTFGDLAFIKMKCNNITDNNDPYKLFLANLEALGLDISVIDTLSD
jgi:hypothetical protein